MTSHSGKVGKGGAYKRWRNSCSEYELHDLNSKFVMYNTYTNMFLGTDYVCVFLFTCADLIITRSQKQGST